MFMISHVNSFKKNLLLRSIYRLNISNWIQKEFFGNQMKRNPYSLKNIIPFMNTLLIFTHNNFV